MLRRRTEAKLIIKVEAVDAHNPELAVSAKQGLVISIDN